MRMMKNNNNETVMVLGIDHGYGNMKTATRCFPSGVARYDKEPIFQNNLLVYNDMYYQIGEEHKEFCAEKTQDEDYYVLTLAAIFVISPAPVTFLFAYFALNALNFLIHI